MGNTLKRIIGVEMTAVLLLSVALGATKQPIVCKACTTDAEVIDTLVFDYYKTLHGTDWLSEQEDIRNEIMYGEIEMLAQLVEAEAGNQDETGKRYVADCVLNRVDAAEFPETVEDVILQKNPRQFSCVSDGGFDKAGWSISEESFRVALEEYTGDRLNTEIIYFRTDQYSTSGHPAFQWGDHYFSTM